MPPLLEAVKETTGADAAQVLADAGFRSEAVFEKLKDRLTELIVSLGRERKKQLVIDVRKRPRTAAMAEKFKAEETQNAYRRRKWLSEPPNGWIKNVLGFRQFSMRGLAKAKAERRLVFAALDLRRMAPWCLDSRDSGSYTAQERFTSTSQEPLRPKIDGRRAEIPEK